MSKVKPGILVSFEGTEGSGKSTLMRELSLRLNQIGCIVKATREPGGDLLAEKIRSLLLSQNMDPRTELFLYEAARAEHWATVIAPALARGEIVLCDRFIDSTLAYQSQARGLPWKEVKAMNRIATQGNQPHLTVFLDIDPALGLERAQDPNRFEAEGIEFQKKVRTGFLKARKEDPKRWLTLKVQNQTPEELSQAVIKSMKTRFKRYFQVPQK